MEEILMVAREKYCPHDIPNGIFKDYWEEDVGDAFVASAARFLASRRTAVS